MKTLLLALIPASLFCGCRHEVIKSPSLSRATVSLDPSLSSFSPRTVPGLVSWWDLPDTANRVVNAAGRVSRLKDKSGNGYDMSRVYDSGHYPDFHPSGGANGLAYMSVQNGQEIYPGQMTLPQPYTLYYVMRNDAFLETGFVLSMDNDNIGFIRQDLQPAGKTLTMHEGNSFNKNTNNYHEGKWQLLSLVVNNLNARMQTNNEAYIQPQYTYNGYNPGSAAGTSVGFAPYYMNSSYSVEELLVYNGIPSTENDSLIRNYLVKKYSIGKNTVAIFFGDSITWGAAATDVDSSSFAADIVRDKGWQIVNWGYPGSVAVSTPGAPGVPGRNGEDLYQLPLQEDVDLSETYVFFAFGHNDVATDSNWVNKYIVMVNAYLAHGLSKNHITVCTMPGGPGGVPSLTPTYSITYENIKKVVAATGVNFYDNITYESSIWNPSYLAPDGVHPTDAGMRSYANGLEQLLAGD